MSDHQPHDRFVFPHCHHIYLHGSSGCAGTGIFNSPQRVLQGTRSTGASLLLWFVGIVYALCGTHVYIEYGLSVPRYTIHGVEQSVPRSGGDLNYLQYVYRRPAYRQNTILLVTCLFGISFVVLGNVFSNCINFALQVLSASGVENPSNGAVRGIAIAVATLTCFIHVFSRKGGIVLNNIFAFVKVGILLLIIVTAIVVGSGGFAETENVITENTSPGKSFEGVSDEANGFAHAFLAIMFSFGGFEQANYVLGEISRPRRTFPIAVGAGVSIVVALYLAVNICYMVVVPKQDMLDFNVAERFFDLTFGKLGGENGHRIFNAFLAVSSLGNIIVMTYAAARMKQEIAKEGILPYAKFFAQNRDLSLGRVLHWVRKKGWCERPLRLRWLSPEDHTEKTPVGAITLHLASSLVFIFATYSMDPYSAYSLLTALFSYVVNAFFGCLLGIGILVLRFRGPPPTDAVHDDDETPARPPTAKTWREMTGPGINPVVSIVTAIIYTLGSLYPVITAWVPPTGTFKSDTTFEWWLIPTVSWCVIGFSALWFIGFVFWAWNMARKHHQVFLVEKRPEFEPADGASGREGASDDGTGRGDGGLVLVHETVYLSWVGRETLRHRHVESQDKGDMTSEVRYAGSDINDTNGHFRRAGQGADMASGHGVGGMGVAMGMGASPVMSQGMQPPTAYGDMGTGTHPSYTPAFGDDMGPMRPDMGYMEHRRYTGSTGHAGNGLGAI